MIFAYKLAGNILSHDPDWIELWRIHRNENCYNLDLALWKTCEAYNHRQRTRKVFQEQKEGGETTQNAKKAQLCKQP